MRHNTNIITLDIPVIPMTVNRMYRGRKYLTIEGAARKEQIAFSASSQLSHRTDLPLSGEIVVTIRVYRPRKSGDLDNYQKSLLDSLTGIVWGDDRQIVELHAYRYDDKNNPHVEVDVLQIGAIE